MTAELKGRRALVLGASQGLGAAIARRYAEAGADLVLVARSEEALEALGRDLGQTCGVSVLPVTCDLGDAHAVEAMIMSLQSGPTIDVAVLNSGGPPFGTSLEIDQGIWRAQFESMVLSQIRLCMALVPAMQVRKWGRILAISSSGIEQPIPGLVVSNALRAALANFLKTLSAEVACDGVTVNLLVPGRIATPRTLALDSRNAKQQDATLEEIEARSKALIPAGRYGEPKEFADAALFLAGETGSYVTGSLLRVDGGLVRHL